MMLEISKEHNWEGDITWGAGCNRDEQKETQIPELVEIDTWMNADTHGECFDASLFLENIYTVSDLSAAYAQQNPDEALQIYSKYISSRMPIIFDGLLSLAGSQYSRMLTHVLIHVSYCIGLFEEWCYEEKLRIKESPKYDKIDLIKKEIYAKAISIYYQCEEKEKDKLFGFLLKSRTEEGYNLVRGVVIEQLQPGKKLVEYKGWLDLLSLYPSLLNDELFDSLVIFWREIITSRLNRVRIEASPLRKYLARTSLTFLQMIIDANPDSTIIPKGWTIADLLPLDKLHYYPILGINLW